MRSCGGFFAAENSGDAAVAQHENAIRAAQQLREFRAHQDDSLPRGRKPIENFVDVLLGADVDAARRVIQEQNVRIGQQPTREQHFLLIAAAQGAYGHVAGRGFQPERGMDLPQSRGVPRLAG